MSIIDSIIDASQGGNGATTPAPTPAPTQAPTPAPIDPHSFTRGDRITDIGRHLLQQKYASFRGYGTDLAGVNIQDTQAVLAQSGLDWKVVPMPLAIQGKTITRPYPGMVALVRSDTGAPLSVASDGYRPHQNGQIMATIAQFAQAANLTITRVGVFENGARGFAVADSGIKSDIRVGDVAFLRIVVKWGHAPGTATTIQAMCEELRCSNGMTITVSRGRARFVHSAELTPERIAIARDFVLAAGGAFQDHVETLSRLRGVPSNRALDTLILAQVLEPDLAGRVMARVDAMAHTPLEHTSIELGRIGARTINAILERDDAARVVESMVQRDRKRLLAAVLSATDRQQGGGMTRGTLAHAHAGMTFYNTHLRGRSVATGVEANLTGMSPAQMQARDVLTVAVAVGREMRGA